MRHNTMSDKMIPPGDGEAKREENLPPDPFDLTALRLSQDFVSMFGVKKLITSVRAKNFGVYGYLATTMSQLFFPGEDKTISLLKAFAVFGVGFVMRPAGSVLFGVYGDRFGRRLALSAVIFLMAFSTVAIGLLPTYAEAGVLAPILLVAFRLLQGLSAGGEWGGSTSYIVEYAPEGPRGFIGSWQQVSVGSGFLLGSLSAALLSSSLSPDAFISWGWRVPFLLGILVGVLGAYLRWRLNDTPKFTEIAQHGEVAK